MINNAHCRHRPGCAVCAGFDLRQKGHAEESDGRGFLNIREAAQFLNVSEVSLRRWTNSGRLPCLRVGRRRERRFTKDDLVAFLQVQSRGRPVEAPAKRSRTPVVLEDLTIERGNHLCSLYRNDLGRLKLAVPLLAEGLRHGEVCFLNAAPEARDDILRNLRDVYAPVDQAIADGRLVLSEGRPSGPEMYDYLERQFTMASRPGDWLFRLVGDMAWAIHQGIDIDDLMAFERYYNHTLGRRFPIVSLCQYDTRLFSGLAVHEALMCHEDTFSYPLSRFL
jgi:transcriptional repressor of dcmA and dcmR